jgi:glycosyltransferase involved in cell wall biosynthesis
MVWQRGRDAFEPRKNIGFLLDAFERVSPSLPDHRLVLAGGGAPSFVRTLRRRVERSNVRDRVDLVLSPSRATTIRLLAQANALLLPSLAEGFGLPILEALALGTPVVASDIPEIRSWTGDEVRLAPPTSSAAWVDGITAAVRSSPEQRRAGQTFARRYRWRACTETLLGY